MCLEIQSITLPLSKIADKDITVYKIVASFTKDTFITLFKHTHVELGQTYDSTLDRPIPTNFFNLYIVEKGLHSFKRKEDAFEYAKKISFLGIKLIILECIIPKGSEYYKGIFSKYSSYASNQLKYIKYVFDSWKECTF